MTQVYFDVHVSPSTLQFSNGTGTIVRSSKGLRVYSSHYHEMLGLRTVLGTTLMMPTKAILLVGPAYIQG